MKLRLKLNTIKIQIACLGIGIITAWADCTYYASGGGGSSCSGNPDCSTYHTPVASCCINANYATSLQYGTKTTNYVTFYTMSGGHCNNPGGGIDGNCQGGTQTGSTPNVKEVDESCSSCPNG